MFKFCGDATLYQEMDEVSTLCNSESVSSTIVSMAILRSKLHHNVPYHVQNTSSTFQEHLQDTLHLSEYAVCVKKSKQTLHTHKTFFSNVNMNID